MSQMFFSAMTEPKVMTHCLIIRGWVNGILGTSEGGSEVGSPKVIGGGFIEGFGGFGCYSCCSGVCLSEGSDSTRDFGGDGRFVAGEPGSSGRLDASGAGSFVTKAVKGTRSDLGSRCTRRMQ
ncbi:hypothetical protein GUJ93_ZPchr0008g14194 [Zizania palustris]|uniref:Uncharacterized protein n=1 Tax=Zizania palustris TaxID=103762 RepID=A0A8J5RZQ6_ZIZPA|nr:hypothetical protein GUJ93_ZPchr0008g14194 [Zizania palustris]